MAMGWRGWRVFLELWIARFCAKGARLPKGSRRQGRDLARLIVAESVHEGIWPPPRGDEFCGELCLDIVDGSANCGADWRIHSASAGAGRENFSSARGPGANSGIAYRGRNRAGDGGVRR